ncbi:MAG: glycosyltransferase family 4 protein [Geodermatophilaceae bacterium]|nr:glycosyltransferase family 4 protein [Geodermatophilaceae bacterium]MDQ3456104.1 glycosyltransferase family 4 protein [Actinomycetota bacterium]
MTRSDQRSAATAGVPVLAGRQIVQVLATSTGGVGTHVRAILPGLRCAGATVRVCGPPATDALFGFGSAGAQFQPVGIASGLRPVQDARALIGLRRALRGADLVHAHGLRAGLLSVLARPAAAVVVTLHNALLDTAGRRGTLDKALERIVIRGADVVLAASLDLAEHARSVGGRDVRSAPVTAPTLPEATRTRSQMRAELGVPETMPLLLAVGRLHPQKGYDTLLSAAGRWRDRTDGLLTVIAGEGPLHAEMSERIAREHLPVVLLGRRSDVANLLSACDLVVLTSQWEARALVAQEALRAGRPLVATAVGGIPELAGQGAGVLIPPNDWIALDAAVTDVLGDPARAAALVEAGRSAAATWPTMDDTVAQLSALYAELLGASVAMSSDQPRSARRDPAPG